MEDDRRQLAVAIPQHRTEHRVSKFAKRGVRGDPTNRDVEALPRKPCRECASTLLFEIPAIGNASGYREAPVLGLNRKLRRGHDVPNDIRALDVGVRAIAAI